MVTVEPRLLTVLPYLLHRGLVEIRYLANSGADPEQIAKLADVLEFLPRAFGPGARPIEMIVVRDQFEQYAAQFPDSHDAARYLAILDGLDTPTSY